MTYLPIIWTGFLAGLFSLFGYMWMEPKIGGFLSILCIVFIGIHGILLWLWRTEYPEMPISRFLAKYCSGECTLFSQEKRMIRYKKPILRSKGTEKVIHGHSVSLRASESLSDPVHSNDSAGRSRTGRLYQVLTFRRKDLSGKGNGRASGYAKARRKERSASEPACPGPEFLGVQAGKSSHIGDLRRAYLEIEHQRWKEALPYLEKALRRFPGRPYISNDFAVAFFMLKRYSDGLYYIDSALRTGKPGEERMVILYNKALFLIRLRRINDAYKCLKLALSFRNEERVVFYLAAIYAMTGKFEDCKKMLDQCPQWNHTVVLRKEPLFEAYLATLRQHPPVKGEKNVIDKTRYSE